jgi:hypothetical protein
MSCIEVSPSWAFLFSNRLGKRNGSSLHPSKQVRVKILLLGLASFSAVQGTLCSYSLGLALAAAWGRTS